MKYLPPLLLVLLLFTAGLAIYLWQTRDGEAGTRSLRFGVRLLDAEGYPLAGVEIAQLHALRREVVGVSDAFGSWQGSLTVTKVLELQFTKDTSTVLLRAQRRYLAPQQGQQEVVRLQAVAPLTARPASIERVRLVAATPFLRQALLAWSRQAGWWVAADGWQELLVAKVKEGTLQVSFTAGEQLRFSFQVDYRQLDSHATVQKILRGIYAHTARAYTAWHDEENQRWYAYNPAGFWRLRADAVLVDARGRQLQAQVTRTRDRQQLTITASDGESVCSQRECVVYSSHPRQNVY